MAASDLRSRLDAFVDFRRNHLAGDEKGEAQVFLDRLFRAFGHDGVMEAGGKLEMRVAKRSHGGTAFADLVWRPHVLIEMKKAREPLGKHYQQAFEYWIDLVPERPKYVVLCNFDEFWIYDLNRQLDEPLDRVTLDELPRRWESLAFLGVEPVAPTFANDLVEVTREAAATVVGVTNALIERGINRAHAQRFTMQAVMAMFGEDTGLLPSHMFTAAIEESASGSSYDLIFGLFREMNTEGETAGGRFKGTPYFNGGLFRDIHPFELQIDELVALRHAAGYDWGAVRPEIFGTLFEQSLGKAERHAFGAHFTSGADIQRVVLPTIVRPWRERIEKADTLKMLGTVEQELLSFRVLDPACGCGNFLYIAYRELCRLEKLIFDKRLEMSVRERGRARGALQLSFVRTNQFFGIDINPFAVEIAKVTLMLARQLATAELAGEQRSLPLDDLDANFVADDALFSDWPQADAIIGNPPYLGRRKLVREHGADYAARLGERYPDIGSVSDFVVYWFRRSHDALPANGRAGLVGTNSIRQVSSRGPSLDYIVDHGGTIVDAWSSLPWSGDAAVHVSIVNWVKGKPKGERVLWLEEGERRVVLPEITGSLGEDLDLRSAIDLRGNMSPKVLFQGQTPGHTKGFVMSPHEASRMRARDPKSSAVLFPYIVGEELLHSGEPNRWVIDFDAPDAMTAKATAPAAYERVLRLVLPDRKAKAEQEAKQNAEALAHNPRARVNWHHRKFLERWWQHSYRREEFLNAVKGLDRFIALAAIASELRRPVFTFVSTTIHPSHQAQCFAFDDDYTFGILHSSLHELWFRGRCSTLKSDLRYTSKTVFNTFPWPQDPASDAALAVAEVAATLVDFRASRIAAGISLAEQYNTLRVPGSNPVRQLHQRLDVAVTRCYVFDPSRDLLRQLLDLNLACAERESEGLPIRGPGARGIRAFRISNYAVTP